LLSGIGHPVCSNMVFAAFAGSTPGIDGKK
jgi:hypothetical protein